MRRRGLLVVAGLVVVVAAAAVVWNRPWRQPPEMAIAGMVRQTEIHVAPEITGRLESIAVRAGQKVRKGERLAVLGNPELAASLGEAEAAARSAAADRARIYSGVRAEEIAILDQSVATAEANLALARQEQARVAALAARDFASRQKLDETDAALAKQTADLALKRAQLDAARAGPTAEERALADARLALAEATAAALRVRLGKTQILAPADGVVGILVVEPGEIVPVGKPILTLQTDSEPWFAFTLREDALRGLGVGSEVRLSTGDGRPVRARVSELRALGEFATWRAARAVGDHDLNSFRVRLDPMDVTPETLRPGMTVWLPAGA